LVPCLLQNSRDRSPHRTLSFRRFQYLLHRESVMDVIFLEAYSKEQVSEIMRAEDNSILLGKVKNLELRSYAINTLPKLSLHEDNKIERFDFDSWEKKYLSEIMRAEDNSILFGKVKRLGLKLCAANILPN
ncbi:MAG: uncharacterized protein A8A55_3179, partial [Amphiamblys sp. WSBS2006]